MLHLWKKNLQKYYYTGTYTGQVQRIVFVNNYKDSSYDYHFIIKELAKEFERQFECLGKNKEK